MSTHKKLILVIGATGAQGLAVIDALLAPSEDGTPSPYSVRALTRNVEHKRAQDLKAKGVECVQGSFEDFPAVFEALKGCYGAWVNTDGFTVGEEREQFAGMRIFELAKQLGTLRHYVWSNLDYVMKKAGYRPEYQPGHYNGKGRVAEFLKAQESDTSDNGMTWSVVTSGPYMDMLNYVMFGPLNKREDGTVVFASPIGDGHVPMISLIDFGYFARYTFDHREEVSGKDLEIVSDMVGWDYLVKTFTEVTGQKAEHKRLTVEDWMELSDNIDRPVALQGEKGSRSWRENFSAFWRMFRDDIIKRDVELNRRIHPKLHSLADWMRETKYAGNIDPALLKNYEDNRVVRMKWEKLRQL